MQIRKLILVVLSLVGVACQSDPIGWDPIELPSSVESVLRVAGPASSRTALGEGDGTAGSAQEIRWAEGDCLSVWAREESASNYLFEATTFRLTTYNATFNSADFLATIPTMEQGRYRYHAVYPLPESRTGTTVSYTLPTTQSGAYDPQLDIMTASTTGNALAAYNGGENPIYWQEPQLQFSHLMHLVRIRIPAGKNLLGLNIKRLDITFPQEVVGTVSFDVKDPENTIQWSNLSNTMTVELGDNQTFDAGQGYLWLHVKPTTLDGEIRFVAYNEAGVMSSEISTTVQKTLAPQRITPIALTIPTSPLAPLSYIDLRETANNLGEDWQTMTLSGYTFAVPNTYTTTSTLQFVPNSSKRYLVAVCADPQSLQGASLPLQYESEHCLFDDPVTLPATMVANGLNRIEKQVPYLLEEDFSVLHTSFEDGTNHSGSDADERKAISLASYGLNDWYGARVGGAAGQNIRIASRIEMGMWITNKNTGRVDTPVLSKLKPSVSASIEVQYDYAGDRYEAVGSGGYPVYSAGTSTSVVEKGDNEIENIQVASVQLAIDGPNANGTYYGNTPHRNTFTASGCSNTTRVCWYVTNNRAAEFAGNGMYWLYIDNVKVKIAH